MIKELLEQWKKDLLNMSRNNNLLYFDEKRGLQIIFPEIKDLFNRILNEDVLTFRRKEDDEQQLDLFGERHVSKYDIKSNVEDAQIEYKKLTNYYKRNKSYNEERGINCLYLSFLFIEWREPEALRATVLSPLLLVPVSLIHESPYSPYKLKLQESDIIVNNTLKHKFQSNFNIELPEFEEGETLDSYKNKCLDILENSDEHFEVLDCTYLAFFHYTNLSIYHDLERNEDKILNNEILRAIGGEDIDVTKNDIVEGVRNIDLDKHINPESVFQVLDADESQRIAIEMAKRGVSFVLQGPPGTGKSQTITNIIAESLAAGKKVLFVSEKEAALNVVKSRLKETNLLDFCLPIHSHDSNKKMVIDDLYRTIDRGIEHDTIDIAKLQRLKERRDELNSLRDEIHRIIEPLSKSIFYVNAELANLEDIPYLKFNIANFNTKTEKELNRDLFWIDKIKQSIANISDVRFDPKWNHCKLETFTLQQKNQFKSSVNSGLIRKLNNIIELSNTITNNGYTLRYKELDGFVEFLLYCSTIDKIPTNWNSENISKLKNKAEKLSVRQKKIEPDDKVISRLFRYEVKEYNVKLLKERIAAASSSINNDTEICKINFEEEQSIETLKQIYSKVSNWLGLIYELLTIDKSNGVLFLDWSNQLISKYDNLKCYINSINKEMDVTCHWLSLESLNEIEALLNELERYSIKRMKNLSIIEECFDKSFLDVDILSMLPKFRSEYDVFYRFLKPSYRKDIKFLKGIYKRGKLTYSDALHYLSCLKTVKESEEWINEQMSLFNKYDIIIKSYSTNFEKYRSYLSTIKTIVLFFNNQIPNELSDYIIQKQCLNDTQITRIITLFDEIEKSNLLYINNRTKTFGDLSKLLQTIEENIHNCIDSIECLEKYALNDVANIRFVEPLIRWQEYIESLESQSDELNKLFSNIYYDGKNTDWNLIQEKIGWFEKYLNLMSNLGIDNSFTLELIEDKAIAKNAETTAKTIREIKTLINDTIIWFNEWFAEDKSLLDLNCGQIAEIAKFYIENIDRFEDYLLYKSTTIKAREYLKDFINRVVLIQIHKLNYEDCELDYQKYDKIYLKSFYTQWLDKEMPNSFLNQLSVENIKAMRKEFQLLDKKQFEIASNRIRKTLKNKMPQINLTMVGANSEMSILRQQHSLNRRHLPLRQLFNKIPNLLLAVKPCIMMSPLSVSIFLENPRFEFDLVIFDEASQIKPEYAIGAILRGKQLIVAGDNKQLPPYKPFEINNNDKDEESILDLCNSIANNIEKHPVLNNAMLKWHYRSKHEGLITTSNQNMYDNMLEIFPSKYSNVQGYGLEYHFVNEWDYEDGINKPEAKLVAKLVFEHYQSYPERSLGVITHNVKQVEEIEQAINILRFQHPECESFFDDKHTERFFIKNIDNVQGDERDTIIYSICYGKNREGNVHQNFGPITQVGGERRINVAITRAKYNLKVVTSLTATDIVVSNNNGITGPKLLKYFLDFAQHGNLAINERIEVNRPILESPFEVSVYNYLRSKNYVVDTQVGCAKYKIDLGIKDPNNQNQYVLAIECDGATYHSSRYARERDRLRQEVLENMGWKFYRIWSTDWIKHNGDSKRRLLEAVKNAINNKQLEDAITHPIHNTTNQENAITDFVNENSNVFETLVIPHHQYKYSKYKRGNGIFEIIQNEEPLSKNRLYRLLCPAFNRQMVTESFKSDIDKILYGLINDNSIKEGNNFLYITPMKSSYPFRKSDRKIDDISNEEISSLIKEIIKSNVSIDWHDLVKVTYKILRCGNNAQLRLNKIINSLINNNTIVEENKRLSAQ